MIQSTKTNRAPDKADAILAILSPDPTYQAGGMGKSYARAVRFDRLNISPKEVFNFIGFDTERD